MGRALQYLATLPPLYDRPMEHQTILRDGGEPAVAAALSEAAQNGAGFLPASSLASSDPGDKSSAVDIYNTSSWPRAGVVMLPREVSDAGDFVTDEQGQPVPAQRLASDELAVLVRDLPPLSGRRYTVAAQGTAPAAGHLMATGATLANDKLRIQLDESTGAITELRATGIDANLVDTASGHALNDYLYLVGDDLRALQRNGPVRIAVRDRGPVVASLWVESDAPGCHKLVREIRLVAGEDYVEVLNTVDKKRLVAASYYAQEGKESVNFAFPFAVPGGEVRLDVPLGVVRPELDQMPSACKNWLSVGRWAEVANADFGVTWVTLDAPLLQVGGITATLLNSQTNPDVWRKKIEPTQKLYAWAMNNHWGTNYRAYQEGPVVFRFVIRPHGGPATMQRRHASQRASASRWSPFPVAASAERDAVAAHEPAEVIVSGLKPSDDGKAIIVRLLGAAGTSSKAN